MILLRLSFSLVLAALLLSLPQAGFAEQSGASKMLGTFGNWKAYASDGDKPICYMTMALHYPPGKLKRGEAFLMITHRPGENSKDVVSYKAGYNFKASSDVAAVIGKKSFDLFTQKDTAWSRDSATDHALASAIRTGTNLKLTGSPSTKGVSSVSDTIPLKGSTAAYDAISKACGYPVEAAPKTAPSHKKKTTNH